jgi:catechol 2,3-dioxygenase
MPDFRLPADARLGRARLRVGDLDRSLAFYRDVLGMQIVHDAGASVVLAPRADAPGLPSTPPPRELLVLHERPGIQRRPARKPVTTGLHHVGLLVPSRGALGRLLLGLHAAEYPVSGMSDLAVCESVYLSDPDGNGLELYADRPRASWPWRDGHVQITSQPLDVDDLVAAGRQENDVWIALPRDTVVGHVHLTTSHLPPAIAFYRDLIGFDETVRVPTLAGVGSGGYHHHLCLNTWAGEGAPRDSERVAGLDAWELVVGDAAARRALVERVARHVPAVPLPDGRTAVTDPDGVVVEITGSEPVAA